MSLKAKIKAGAESLGFVSVGFTSVEPVPELQHYRNWIRNGQYAGMDYLASTRALETRSDPKKLLPSCKTVISLLSAYPPPATFSMPGVAIGAAGKIAAYALLGDYHDVLRERLESCFFPDAYLLGYAWMDAGLPLKSADRFRGV